MPEVMVGKVSDFYRQPMVAGIEATAPIKEGYRIHIKGHTTDLECTVDSMQIDHRQVSRCKAGDSIGIKVPDRVRKDDTVYVEL